MATEFFCPECGGIIGLQPGASGRACGCGATYRNANAATAVADPNSHSTATGGKICCQCGADVTGKRRMKDRQGKYWCYECGSADSLKHQVGTASQRVLKTMPNVDGGVKFGTGGKSKVKIISIAAVVVLLVALFIYAQTQWW